MSTDCPVCVLCGLAPVKSMSARGMRPFCRMVMMRATIVDRFFHNRVFKISRYCKILGCYLYLCRQIAYFLNNASCARQNVSKLPLPSLALPLNNASCARQNVSKLSLPSLALPLNKSSCARQNVSKLPLPSLALPLNNASCARQTERKLLLRLESRDDDIKRK